MKVSVIVPAYNEEQVIGKCLDALLAQTVAPDEILVVDNNSTDKTIEIVETYKDRGVKLIREPRQGLIPARNRGFDEATGDILGRIDADTIVEPNWVEVLREMFADPEVAAATGPSYFYDAPGQKVAKRGLTIICHETNEIISGHKMLWGSNMALSKKCWQIIRDHVCVKPDILEDLDLAIHMHDAGLKIAFSDKLVTGVSARRFQSSGPHLYKYLKMWPDTYRLHGDKKATRAAQALIPAILMIHAPIYVVLRGYDPTSKSFSIRQFIKHEKFERANP